MISPMLLVWNEEYPVHNVPISKQTGNTGIFSPYYYKTMEGSN